MTERSDRRWVDGEVPDPETEAEKKLKRKREQKEAREQEAVRKQEAADRSAEPNASDRPEHGDQDGLAEERRADTERLPEPEVRKIIAEAAFRNRVELAELRESVGKEAYAELRQRYGPDLRWYLEEGPLLLRAVVAESEPKAGTVKKITVRYAVSRETEPSPPAETVGKAKAVFAEPASDEESAESREAVILQAEGLAEDLPPEETLELVVDTADHGPVLVRIDRGTVEVHESISEDSPVVERRTVETEPSSEPEPSAEPLETAAQIASETAAEPLSERPRSAFAKAIEAAEYAWAAERMPRIAGGSPELDVSGQMDAAYLETAETDPEAGNREEAAPELPEEQHKKPPVVRKPEPPTPEGPVILPSERTEPRRPSRRQPPRRPTPEFRGLPGPEGLPPLPDADTRRRAKRMLRKLAARFGLRLTPDLEGYLMQIVFRLRYVDGRLRRGISVNIDVLIRVMEALRSHYPLYTPKRRS